MNTNKTYKYASIAIVILAIIILSIFAGDIFNLSENVGIHLRFDWATILCTFLSAIASFVLCTITVMQNREARETNERLARVNERSFKLSTANNNYSLLKFREKQYVIDSGKTLKLTLHDTNNRPLKELRVEEIFYQPLEHDGYTLSGDRLSVFGPKPYNCELEYTPVGENVAEEFYFANIPIARFPIDTLEVGDRFRLDFVTKLKNHLGVITSYKEYRLMLKVSKKDVHGLTLTNFREYNYFDKIDCE